MSQNILHRSENPRTAENVSAIEEYDTISSSLEIQEGDFQPLNDDYEDGSKIVQQTAKAGFDTLPENQDKSNKTHKIVHSSTISEVIGGSERQVYDGFNDSDEEIIIFEDYYFQLEPIVQHVKSFKEKRSSLQKKSKLARIVSALGIASGVIGGAIGELIKYASSTKGEYFITLFRIWLKLLHNYKYYTFNCNL